MSLTRAHSGRDNGGYRNGLGGRRWNDYCSWRLDCYWNGLDLDGFVSDSRSLRNRNDFSQR